MQTPTSWGFTAASDSPPLAWRSPELASAAAEFAEHQDLAAMNSKREKKREFGRSTRPDRRSGRGTAGQSTRWAGTVDGTRDATDAPLPVPEGKLAKRCRFVVHATGQTMRDDYSKKATGDYEPFPVLQSKGADGQRRIEAEPDAYWEWKKAGEPPILQKAGHLLVSMGQNTSAARVTAVASDNRYVGQGWMPVTGVDASQAKAAAVFLNSTPGRLLLMRQPGKSLVFPFYNPAVGARCLSPTWLILTFWARSQPAGKPPATRLCRNSATAIPTSANAGTTLYVTLEIGTSTRSQTWDRCSHSSRVSEESRTDSGMYDRLGTFSAIEGPFRYWERTLTIERASAGQAGGKLGSRRPAMRTEDPVPVPAMPRTVGRSR